MPEEAPTYPFPHREIFDEVLTLLDAFAQLPDSSASRGRPSSRSLRKVVEDLHDHPKDDVSHERDQLDMLARVLARGTADGEPLHLYITHGKRGSFATPEALRMRQAARVILDDRKKDGLLQRALPYIQLVSAADQRVLRIGGYQAHYERFLGAVVARLRRDFPWITVESTLEEDRNRERGGLLRAKFEGVAADEQAGIEAVAPEIDYMLEPNDAPPTCYRYTLRVVSTADELKRVTKDNRELVGIPIDWLSGEVLLIAPANHSSRDLVEKLLSKHKVEPSDRVPVTTPLMLLVRGLAGQGFAILSDEYSSIGYPGNPFPYLLEGSSPFTRNMRMRSRPELSGGVHLAMQYVIHCLRNDEEEQRWLGRPSALR